MDFSELLVLLGALGLFIYGMIVMSEGIQKLAGNKMRDVLGAMTSNRFKGIFTGFVTTSIIQSSSATTVMIVSFVNAGLLNLRQAIGVIMGANIGTTMTAWILVFFGFSKFSIGDYVFPLLAFAVPLFFINKEIWKNLGEFLIGFALLFLGLDGMKAAVEGLDLANNESFRTIVAYLSEQGFVGIILLVLVGTLVTIIVQSSSAAMAVTLTLCGTMGLSFEMAAAIILGENIGTTITANLAAIVGNVHAKRAARAHFIFNVFGVIWMLVVFNLFIHGIGYFMERTEYGSPFINTNDESIRRSLSLFHSTFNIVNTFVLVWFVGFIEKVVIKMTPSRNEDDEVFKLEYIGSSILSTPEISLLEAKKEIMKFAEILQRMHKRMVLLVNSVDKKEKEKLVKKIAEYEVITDRIHEEITNFLSKLTTKEVTERTSIRIRGLLGASNDLETMGDLYYNMAKQVEKKTKAKIWFTTEQRASINDYFAKLEAAMVEMVANLNKDEEKISLAKAESIEKEINDVRNKLRKKHLKSIEKGEYNYESGMVYNNLFSGIEKIGDYVINVSESVSGRNLN